MKTSRLFGAAAVAALSIAANSGSSSFLPILERHMRADPTSRYVATETVPVVTIDSVVRERAIEGPYLLKLDVQGYEGPVLAGAAETLRDIKLIFIELLLAPLYEGAAGFVELYSRLESAQFRCIGLQEAWADGSTDEALAVDGIFVRG